MAEKKIFGHYQFPPERESYARSTDPETSHIAAASKRNGKNDRLFLGALASGPKQLDDFVRLTGVEKVSVSPAMRPLARLGLVAELRDTNGEIVTRKGLAGKPQIVWCLAGTPPVEPVEVVPTRKRKRT